MSVTDELRRMLDERVVDWDYGITGAETTRFNANGLHLTFTPMRYGLVCSTILTPEQAVEVTLGPSDPREHGLIPHFWTGDETLHIDLGKLPERIDVTLPDPRGREVYSARVHRFEPEREECHAEQDWDNDETPQARWWRCDACGEKFVHLRGLNPIYCPECGRKVVGE